MKRNLLRPVFFRAGAFLEICSGWIDTKTMDIWALSEDVRNLSVRCLSVDAKTASSLMCIRLNDDEGMVLVPGAKPALLSGERVRFRHEIDIYPEGFVEPGDRGVVVRRDRTTGTVEVCLEGFQIGDNLLALTPHQVEHEVLSGILPHSDIFTAAPSLQTEDFQSQ